MSTPASATAGDDALIVFVSCPTEAADRIAGLLVEQRCAACVSLLPGMRSVYRWQGTIERSDESLLLCKTVASRYEALERLLRERHPYELPEIVAVKLQTGLPDYLQWLHDNSH